MHELIDGVPSGDTEQQWRTETGQMASEERGVGWWGGGVGGGDPFEAQPESQDDARGNPERRHANLTGDQRRLLSQQDHNISQTFAPVPTTTGAPPRRRRTESKASWAGLPIGKSGELLAWAVVPGV